VISERRQHERFEINLIAEATAYHQPDHYVGMTGNISQEGFNIECQNHDLKPGETLELNLKYPSSDLSASALVEIVWRKEAWYTCVVGIKFTSMEIEARSKIFELIAAEKVKPSESFHNDDEELKRSEVKWQAAFETVDDAIVFLDMEGKIQRCNKATLNLIGGPHHELAGHSLWEFTAGATQSVEECFTRMTDTHSQQSIVVPLRDRWFKFSFNSVFDEHDFVIGRVCVISDITDQKKLEEYSVKFEEMSQELTSERNKSRELLQRESKSKEYIPASDREAQLLNILKTIYLTIPLAFEDIANGSKKTIENGSFYDLTGLKRTYQVDNTSYGTAGMEYEHMSEVNIEGPMDKEFQHGMDQAATQGPSAEVENKGKSIRSYRPLAAVLAAVLLIAVFFTYKGMMKKPMIIVPATQAVHEDKREQIAVPDMARNRVVTVQKPDEKKLKLPEPKKNIRNAVRNPVPRKEVPREQPLEEFADSQKEQFIVYKELFNKNNRDVFNTSKAAAQIEDGAYQLENKTDTAALHIPPYHDFPNDLKAKRFAP